MIPQPAETKPMGELGRIANVFLEPKAAFADIAARPRPWVALALVIVMGIAYMATFSQRIGWAQFLEQQGERSSQMQNMSAEQRAKVGETYARMGGIMDKGMPIVPLITVPLFTLLVAGIYAFIFRTMMSADVTFKQLFGITAYAWLPDVLGQAAALTVLLLKAPEDFNFENPVAFNVGAFLDPQATSKAVMSLATSIDLFSFWKLALLAVGISVAARRLSFGKALACVSLPWIVYVLGKTGIAALRG